MITKEQKERVRIICGQDYDSEDVPALWRQVDELEPVCEACGGEVKDMRVGDECYDKCVDCGFVTC